MTCKDENQFEVRRADVINASSAARQSSSRFETVEARLSSDGRTVTSLKASNNMDNSQLVEVWDSGKSSLCQVNLTSTGDGSSTIRVTAFLQARLINKNCLFVCVKDQRLDVLEEGHHELRCYEIGRDGQSAY